MSDQSIKPSMLKENETVFVRGNVTFSRITRHIAGDELIRDQKRRERLNLSPITKPFITITVTNARVIPRTPGQLTLEEQYIQNRFYHKPADNSENYSIQSKSPYLPWISQADPDNPKKITQIKPVGEPANGLDVTLVLRSFSAGQGPYANNKGWNLDGVIANEPIRYYSGTDTASRMAAAGLTFIPLPAGSVPVTDLEAPAEPIENAPVAPMETAEPVTPVAPPVGNPYASSAQQSGFGGMTPPVTPAQDNGTWTCPTCGTAGNTGKFCQNCAAPKPVNVGNPYGNTNAGGIMYDPNQLDNTY